MKLVIQRVTSASVAVDGETIGSIGKGYMVLWGAGLGDTKEQAKAFADKLLKLRIFEDENGKMNLSIQEIKGSLLVISQFTLYADCRKGNRPSFVNAMPPRESEELYEYFLAACGEHGVEVQRGRFGAHMDVSLVNSGPVTIILEG